VVSERGEPGIPANSERGPSGPATTAPRAEAVTERVLCTVAAGIADVRLNRPEKRNALDVEMFRAIVETADAVGRDDSVRVVVLSGEGKGFSAGLDLAVFAEAAAGADLREVRDLGPRSVRVWLELPVPVIAAVHGVAVGGGLQLALGADLRVVAPDARLGMFEMRWGIVPDLGGTQLLPRLVGADVAKDLIMTAREVSGDEALRIGLATRLADDPRAAALALAAEIAAQNPVAVRLAKELVDVARDAPLAEGLAIEFDRTRSGVGAGLPRDAIRAALERREQGTG
jgi:enoyl-CoA hydratase/carnithine racemase